MEKNVAIEALIEVWQEAMNSLKWPFVFFLLFVVASLLYLYIGVDDREVIDKLNIPSFECPKP
jgi:hypothetical protein